MGQYIPLGIYAWNPNGNDPAAEADFENRVSGFTQTVGVAPTYIDAFLDTSSWSAMVASAQWDAWSQSRSPVAATMHPVAAVPLGTWADHGTNTLLQIANGQHDDVYRGVAEAYKAAGYSSVDIRVGWEMDGNYMPWSMGDTAASVSAWTAAFAHVADVLHSVSGIKVNVVWNPGLTNNSAVSVASSYPGDDKVDVIGLDIYSHTYKYDASVSDQQFYDYPGASAANPTGDPTSEWGLAQTMSFAAQHGKPVAIDETGVATGDNTALPQAIASAFDAPGAPTAAYVNIWDVTTPEGDWQFTGGNNPAAGQAWAAALGSGRTGSVSPTAATALVTPQQTSSNIGSAVISAATLPDAGPVIFLTSGANRAEAGWGAMDVSGDAGGDLYVVSPHDAALIVENFSASKGDVLAISSALQGSLSETQTSNALVLGFGSDQTASVYLKGVTSLDPSAIRWS